MILNFLKRMGSSIRNRAAVWFPSLFGNRAAETPKLNLEKHLLECGRTNNVEKFNSIMEGKYQENVQYPRKLGSRFLFRVFPRIEQYFYGNARRNHARNAFNNSAKRLLEAAVRNNHESIGEGILNQLSVEDSPVNEGTFHELLDIALSNRNMQIIKLLSAHAAPHKIADIFYTATEQDDIELVKVLLPAAKHSDYIIEAALNIVAKMPESRLVRLLLDNSSYIDEALSIAISVGNAEFVKAVFAPGSKALVVLSAIIRNDVFKIVITNNDLEILELLLAYVPHMSRDLCLFLTQNISFAQQLQSMCTDEVTHDKPQLKVALDKMRKIFELFDAIKDDNVSEFTRIYSIVTSEIAEEAVIEQALIYTVHYNAKDVANYLYINYPKFKIHNDEELFNAISRALSNEEQALNMKLLIQVLDRCPNAPQVLRKLIDENLDYDIFTFLLEACLRIIELDQDFKRNIRGPRYEITGQLKGLLNTVLSKAISTGHLPVFNDFMAFNLLNLPTIFSTQAQFLRVEWQPGPHRALMSYLTMLHTNLVKYEGFVGAERSRYSLGTFRHDYLAYNACYYDLRPFTYSHTHSHPEYKGHPVGDPIEIYRDPIDIENAFAKYSNETLFIVLLILLSDTENNAANEKYRKVYLQELQKILLTPDIQTQHPDIAYAAQQLCEGTLDHSHFTEILAQFADTNPEILENLGIEEQEPQDEEPYEVRSQPDPSFPSFDLYIERSRARAASESDLDRTRALSKTDTPLRRLSTSLA